jgi:hypothetical protein
MILANIRNKEKDLTVTVPCQRETLAEDLASIGVWNPQGDIFLRDEAGRRCLRAADDDGTRLWF